MVLGVSGKPAKNPLGAPTLIAAAAANTEDRNIVMVLGVSGKPAKNPLGAPTLILAAIAAILGLYRR